MGRKVCLLVSVSVLLVSTMSMADFKYTQTSQITGGAMAGMVKAMGVFSKKLREPAETTTYVKGGYLRSDHADGSYQIIDLDGRRFIEVYPHKSAYSVMTFEQMREAMEKAAQRMHDEMQRQANEKKTNVTITPKIDVSPTGRTQTLLGQSAQEVNIKIEMEMQATGQNQAPQNASFSTTVDSWVAPSVAGYAEVANFYKKMATEIGWSPNASFGMDPRVAQSMVALYREGKIPAGLPLLQVISLVAAGQVPPQGAQQPSEASSSSQEAATPSEVAAKALGGMFGGFGGFGHKKKKQPEESSTGNANPAANSAATASLMEITARVVSFSADTLDAALFQVPEGYKQVQPNMEKMLAGEH